MREYLSRRVFLFSIIAAAIVGGIFFSLKLSRNYYFTHDLTPSPTPPPENVRMVFVGDIMLTRDVGERILESGDFKFPFLKIADYLRGADITFGNLETTISNRGIRTGSIYSFRSDPRVLEGLKYSGFNVLSLANNHIWDYSQQAFLDTMSYLRNSGIKYIGAGENFNEAHSGEVITIKGLRMGFLAYTNLLPVSLAATEEKPGIAIYDPEQMKTDIQNLKTKSDFVTVSFHFGEEYKLTHNQTQEIMSKSAIDHGARLVIGHHPHVIQEVTQYKNGWIAYSLGNFVFDQYFSEPTMEGLALEVIVDTNGEIQDVVPKKINISRLSQPELAPGN